MLKPTCLLGCRGSERRRSASVFEVLQSPVLNTSDLKPAMTAKQPQSLNEVERDTIAKTLELCNGRRKMAAEQLGISERTLYRKIKEYGLE